MENILEELNQVPGIAGSMIVGKDGLVIFHLWEDEVEIDLVGAHTAEIVGSVEALTSESLQFGLPDILTFETEKAIFFIKSIDEATFLAAAVQGNANLGLLRVEVKQAAEKLREVL